MYAIAFDLDTKALSSVYPSEGAEAWRHAYRQIGRVLEDFGFHSQQGSVYFGDADVDPVRCVLATQELSARYPWFRYAVKDIRMLRIEENNDLMPAVGAQGSLGIEAAE